MDCSHTPFHVSFLYSHSPSSFFLAQASILLLYLVGFYIVQRFTFMQRTGGIMLLRITTFLSLVKHGQFYVSLKFKGKAGLTRYYRISFQEREFCAANNLYNQLYFVVTPIEDNSRQKSLVNLIQLK